jgi:hypothetical protein
VSDLYRNSVSVLLGGTSTKPLVTTLALGWFHEVTSFSGSGSSTLVSAQQQSGGRRSQPKNAKRAASSAAGVGDTGCRSSSNDRCHMAVNYWFHPPDNMGRQNKHGFAQPYKSDYW